MAELSINMYCVVSLWEEAWPSGKMSDCNARGREFNSWSGQNKFTKSDGQ